MKLHLSTLEFMKYGGLLLLMLSLVLIATAIGGGQTFLTRYYARYVAYLDRTLRLLFVGGSGRKILLGQVGAAFAIIGIQATIELPFWYLLLGLDAVAPALYLSNERSKRIEKLETQIDSFILALANSLKTVPSASAALASIAPILTNPTRQEIERVLKEMRVGNTLEQALLNMSSRIGSRAMDSALSAVLIGLQVGGNLPAVLENTAETIREMNRLEGVVKTKTSEGRAQLWVLAVFPFAICGAFNLVSPGYFEPLTKSVVGYIIITAATGFWIGSLLVARKVLTVDI